VRLSPIRHNYCAAATGKIVYSFINIIAFKGLSARKPAAYHLLKNPDSSLKIEKATSFKMVDTIGD